jgi:hypothetical protein
MFPETYLDRSLGNITMGFFLSFVIAAFVPKALQSAETKTSPETEEIATSLSE